MGWLLALLIGGLGGEAEVPGPCADGGWGAIPGPNVVHVRADGADDGDGTEGAPLRTVTAALHAVRDRRAGDRVIGVGPGVFVTDPIALGTADGGVMLTGCGAGDTLLFAANDAEPLVTVADTEGAVAGMGLVGGGVAVRDRAVVVLEDVQISEASGPGVSADDAVVELDRVTVLPPAADAPCGYGLAATDSLVLGEELVVVGADAVGVWLSGALVDLALLDVAMTEPRDDGLLGRGLHAEDSLVRLGGGAFSGNQDASLFLDRTGADILGIVIDITAAGIVGDATSGDGILVVDSGERHVQLRDVHIAGSDRAALLLDHARAHTTGVTVDGAGLVDDAGSAVAVQNDGRLLGDGAGRAAELVDPLPWADVLLDCGV